MKHEYVFFRWDENGYALLRHQMRLVYLYGVLILLPDKTLLRVHSWEDGDDYLIPKCIHVASRDESFAHVSAISYLPYNLLKKVPKHLGIDGIEYHVIRMSAPFVLVDQRQAIRTGHEGSFVIACQHCYIVPPEEIELLFGEKEKV